MIKRIVHIKSAHLRKSLLMRLTVVIFVFSGLGWFMACLPAKLFEDPCSTVLLSANDDLLAAHIAEDGQWRIHNTEAELPYKFEKCILAFEDRYFYYHPGFNPFSILRALLVNLKHGKIIQGGSTITMQVIRLSRKGQPRTLREKIIELIWALRLEIRSSKTEILKLYASNAPFGGNVVGINAAAWRYFGRDAGDLSWGESATLAVLPNAPSVLHPGRNRKELRKKRNKLLHRLKEYGVIDSVTCWLACYEKLIDKPLPLPSKSSHLLTRVIDEGKKGKLINSTINKDLQEKVFDLLNLHSEKLAHNKIHNMAALVADVKTGAVLAYVGNSKGQNHNNQVDVITSARSTGSILKPFLFALMIKHGEILSGTLIPDIPVMFAGYSPKNFDNNYRGAVPAEMALSRSLNIPSVIMLKRFGVERFYDYLKKMGINTINEPASHYGLSLILGGAEGSLWDITGVYASFSRILNNFYENDGLYNIYDVHSLHYQKNAYTAKERLSESNYLMDAGSVWLTYSALRKVNRPETEYGWENFSSSSKIAWKTGTSFGFRDAWAVGTDAQYVVGVWAGNADGEGRPGLVGVKSAAPLLFDIFKILPGKKWFDPPYDEMVQAEICPQSGYLPGPDCPEKEKIWMHKRGINFQACTHHQLLHLDEDMKFRLSAKCASVFEMQHVPWFVLPPAVGYYYKNIHPEYKPVPPFREGCGNTEDIPMEFIYPKKNARIYIPREHNNERGKVVFKLAHQEKEVKIFWYLDNTFLGSTASFHQMALRASEGEHELVVIDEKGNVLKNSFFILGKSKLK